MPCWLVVARCLVDRIPSGFQSVHCVATRFGLQCLLGFIDDQHNIALCRLNQQSERFCGRKAWVNVIFEAQVEP